MELNTGLVIATVSTMAGAITFLLYVLVMKYWDLSKSQKQTYLTGIMALFHEGGIAADRGQGAEENPYDPPGPEHRAWLFGFNVRHRQISEVAEAVERVVRTSRQEVDRLRAAHAINSEAIEDGDELDPVTANALDAFKRRNDPPPGITYAKDHLTVTQSAGGTPVDAPIVFGQHGDIFTFEHPEDKVYPGDDFYK